ncbi:hypothetical protein [Glutamicibacter creatinolyticus]|uniref:hypothetical protein n=1 Tax=Glutamicibacter creatinolyticus TaxID=162496 RepID=UPI0032164F4A
MNEISEPIEIWHYTDAIGLLGMVRDRCLWAGCTDFMNDEKEAVKGFEMLRERWGMQGTENIELADRETIDQVIEEMENSRTRQNIVSASGQSDSLTMWRNYGREAVSYAVRLDPKKKLIPVPLTKYKATEGWPEAPEDYFEPYLEEIQDEDGSVHMALTEDPDAVHSRQRIGGQKVEYSSAKQIEIVDEVAEAILSYQKKVVLSGKKYPGTLFKVIHQMRWEEKLTLIKDHGFHDEEEARLHFFGVSPEWRFVHYRPTALGVTPYIVLTEAEDQTTEIDGFGSDVFEPVARRLPILQVRIGPTRYPDLAIKGLRNLLDENGHKNVEILQSEIPFR